jgi:HEAT repeat protein
MFAHRSHRLAACLLLAVAPSRASAQVVLPGQKGGESKEKAGNLAPHLVCTVCGERNYNLHDDGRRDEAGHVIAWCSHCKRDTAQNPPSTGGSGEKTVKMSQATSRRLVLPQGATGTESGKPSTAQVPPATKGTGPASSGPAAFILSEVRRLKNPEDSLGQRAVESLLALGPDGIQAARESLSSEEAPVLLCSARVLLRSGPPADSDLVFHRVREALPAAAGAPLVELLVRSDPIRASPAFLAEMLDHPHLGVRSAAQKHLAAVAGADLLPLLAKPLASKRADTRKRALELVSGVDGSAATELLLERIADPSASVAGAAVDGLAARPDPDLDAKLIGQAFRERWILRPGACALVAIVEREDRTLKPILDETRVEALLAGLQSGDPFLSGTCAAALAGIGFRSRDAGSTTWLDQDVVDRLVSAVSGHVFHSDLPLLQSPALRRLELVSGQGIGADGPRWVTWWLSAREGFLAHRAWLTVAPEDASRIRLAYKQAGSDPRDFLLVGPESDDGAPSSSGSTEVVRLSPAEARDLVGALAREGIFGPERLPGLRGLRGAGERTLEVAIGAGAGAVHGARGKGFVFGAGQDEDWFDRTVALAKELEDRGRWQRYPDPSRQATRADLWKEQSGWWSEEHGAVERALRLKQLVLVALPSLAGPARERAIGELERLYSAEKVAEPADYAPLYRALTGEAYWAESARRLLALTLAAARAPGAVGAAPPQGDGAAPAATADRGPARPPAREIAPEQAKALVDLLVEKLSTAPPAELARVFVCGGPEFASRMAADPRPAVRAAAARALGESPSGEPAPAPSPETVATLMRLVGDKEEPVEVAAVESLGRLRVESARTELLVRARLGTPDVRAAALRAVGKLGGELVLDALALGAASADVQVRTAAAWGLADLRDPSSAPLLIGMLGQGEQSPTTEPARAGLLAMGSSAWTELLRVVHSPTHRARRDAALLLSRQCVPEAASPMIAILSSDPRDEHVASELAVLTSVDLRGEPDPASAWWAWWDTVVHDDGLAWFLSALSRAGATPPAKEAFAGAGRREARLFLLEVLGRKEPHFVERARRELGRMLARDLGPLPLRGAERSAWIEALRAGTAEPEPK